MIKKEILKRIKDIIKEKKILNVIVTRKVNHDYSIGVSDGYNVGWNNCLKEITKFIENLEENKE